MHSINWAGNICKLVNESGEEINIGHQFEDERENRLLLLEGGRAPHKPSSSGKVTSAGVSISHTSLASNGLTPE